MNRSAGVLMPLTMLSGLFGIGVMGTEATEFIDFLRKSGFHAWQMLPVEHTGTCFSPYKAISAFAGEPMLIDPRGLLELGLITDAELSERTAGLSDDAIDYPLVHEKQWTLFRTAFSRLDAQPYANFNPFWLDDYTQYMAAQTGDEAALFHFVQWLFDLQWRTLKQYANERNISLIGDVPIYVSEDSVEVSLSPELFETNPDGTLPAVGGAPPDYFNPNGQRWGNPVYDWTRMKAEGYQWWIDRIGETLKRFDLVRLDHFRGFDRYWRIPADCPDGKDGKWTEGPGLALFQALEKALGTLPVFAEDLGMIDEGVETLLAETGFPGVRVLQFGFDDEEGRHLPHSYEPKSVAYTGTHDNTTLLAWMYEMRPEEREKALFYLGFTDDWTRGGADSSINKAWIRALYMSPASLVIVPIQDLLGYGADTRTNIPGTPENNWRFRIRPGTLGHIDSGFYMALSRMFGRDQALFGG